MYYHPTAFLKLLECVQLHASQFIQYSNNKYFSINEYLHTLASRDRFQADV